VDRIMGLYRNATSEVQINGFRSHSIPIRRSTRQGCPLSMLLYTLCLNPLLHLLDEKLTGIRIGRGSAKTVAVAYADDVTVFLTAPSDERSLQESLHAYESATGARLILHKSRVLTVGGWDISSQILNIRYHNEIKIFGITLQLKINVASKVTCCNIITQVQAAAQEVYYRELSLDMRIQYVHTYLLARIWYTAQLFPIPMDGIRRLNATLSWFLWQGGIFRVSLSTLQRGRIKGGWDLVNVWAKSRTLFLYRLQEQRRHGGSPTPDWLRKWDSYPRSVNPPYPGMVPAALGYLRAYIADAAYIPSRGTTDSATGYKTKMYLILRRMDRAAHIFRR